MSLAEELLADLESDEDEIDDDKKKDFKKENENSTETNQIKMEIDEEELKSLSSVAKLNDSEEMREVLEKMELYGQKIKSEIWSFCEGDPEYRLIVDANNLAAEIDNEINIIYKFAINIYFKKFPECETLVVNPLEYLMTARELGNNLESAKNNGTLSSFLSPATIMVVTVTASTAAGTDLSKEELKSLEAACSMALSINEKKKRIYDYVESKMGFIAPNLSNIVGASTAAKLMGAAGGLIHLSKMPANTVSLLGQEKKSKVGFSQRLSNMPHTGFIFHSELVQGVPMDLRRKVSRVVGAKCTLAARVDAARKAMDGSIGNGFRDEIERKIDKFSEPPPVKAIKALPAPLEAPKKKRGGRRVRQMKERYAVTELRKQANRMNFGELGEDVYQSDLSYSRGNVGKSGIGGGIRMAQIDERTKVRISQTLKRNLQNQQAYFGTSTTVKKHVSGTASSVAFTPLQGLEIVNPQAAEKRSHEDGKAKYFSATAEFMKVKTPAPQTT